MTVLETDLVDYIYLEDQSEMPVLVVSDPLSWGPPEHERHMEVLRSKLNTQIAFVESGQIRQVFPPFNGGLVKVEVIGRCPLSNAAHHFYGFARRVMKGVNMELCFQLWDA